MNEETKIAQIIIEVLKKKGEIHLLPKILEELKKEIKREKLVLVLARKFDQETLEKIKRKLKEIFGEREIKIEIDKEIIGGFSVKSTDHLLDATVRGILNKMKK